MEDRQSGSFSSFATYSYYANTVDRRDSFLSSYAEPVMEDDCKFKYVELEFKANDLRVDESQTLFLVCEVQELENRNSNRADGEVNWKTIGRTEEIGVSTNQNCPVWTNRVRIWFLPKKIQQVRFCLINSRNGDMCSSYVWYCHSILSDIIGDYEKHFPLFRTTQQRSDGTEYGEILTIIVHTEETSPKLKLKMVLSGQDLRSTRTFSSQPNAYFRISYRNASLCPFHHLYESEVKKKDMSPKWKPTRIKIPSSNAGTNEITLKIEVFDNSERNGKNHSIIGETTVSMKNLLRSRKLQLRRKWNRIRYTPQNHSNAGSLIVEQARVKEMPSFKKMIQDGIKLNFVIAIDFSFDERAIFQHHNLPVETNSEMLNEDSNIESAFLKATKAVGSIIDDYTRTQPIHALGFSAKMMTGTPETQYCFTLNGTENSEVDGSKGLIDAYNQTLGHVRLSGPPKFVPLLAYVSSKCNEFGSVTAENQHYTILIIMSNGNIEDFNETVEKVIEISHTTPMCIVVVGVGGMGFSKMEELDSDDELLENGTKRARYDIVQFFEYTDGMSPDELEAAIFDEVSTLAVDYMTDHDAIQAAIGEH